MEGYNYSVLGAGKQGMALGWYLAQHGNAESIRYLDVDGARADATVETLATMLPDKMDVFGAREIAGVEKIGQHLTETDVLISALPHAFNLAATNEAIKAGASYCDYGFDANIVRSQLRLSNQARSKGLAVVPNCGVGPGLTNILATGGAIEYGCDTVKVYIGGNPVNPTNAMRYEKAFAGLIHEYYGTVTALENCQFVEKLVPSEPELVEVPGVGQLEGFYAQTAFGLTANVLWDIGVDNAFEKTLRWPGHYRVIKALSELGFMQQEAVEVDGAMVSPVKLTEKLLDERLPVTQEDFLALMVSYEKDSKQLGTASLYVESDPETGFTAMQRSTSSAVAVVARMLAEKIIEPGAHLPEESIDHHDMIQKLAEMSINVTWQTTS